MNIADKLKSNIVVIPVVASIVVGSFTGIKYVLNLTNTINSNKQAIYILQDKIIIKTKPLKKLIKIFLISMVSFKCLKKLWKLWVVKYLIFNGK